MQNEHPPNYRRKLSPLKIASYAGFAVGALVLVCVPALLFFPDPLVNRFIKPRITKAFAKAYPAYSLRIADMNYSVLKNRFGFDSVALSAVDGTFSGNVDSFSVSGIGWMHLLWGGKLAPNDFASSVVDAQDIVLSFPQSHYELRCGPLRLSVPDSEIVVEALKLQLLDDDEQFFAGSKFRKTRFRLVVPYTRVMGFACLELLQGKIYRTSSVQIHDAFLDILVNKDKPSAKDSSRPSPLMPNQILSSIKGTLQVDSLSIMNGRLNYGERFTVGSKPAMITFDNMQVLAESIANHGDRGAALVIHAQGIFMKAATMNVLMSIPVASPEFSLQYSGSLSRMDLSALNSYLETAEQIRIKAGVLEAATFEINVASGRASGTLQAVYRDLSFAVINKDTRSEKGFFDGIASFIANTFKIRGSNVPDKSGSIKIGEVKCIRQRNDSFFRFVWHALRSGVKDVVGF
ncbi:hypothetical protein A2V82_07350 [candidate division KSB1 bacterium RBG_16_48_16]|nr:MAG: hypothetical protein A2V82_07350 [candidate division KSB1 bacterium RBG_16_48_16]